MISGWIFNKEDVTLGTKGRHNVKKPKASDAQKADKSAKKDAKKK